MDHTDESSMELLEREILFLHKTLADYGYFMGDASPYVAPWRMFDGKYDALLSTEVESWIPEGALLLALAVLWGQRDGAHSIHEEDATRISAMAESLRSHSSRTREIVQAIDIVRHEVDDGVVTNCLQAIYRKFIVGYLKELASRAEKTASTRC